MKRIQYAFGNKDRDWPEDFEHENGQYINRCCRCNQTFIGYKRRAVCKLCASAPPVVEAK